MPEPGQTPQPTIKQGSGPEALPWGESAQVNDLVGLVPPQEEQGFTPQGDQEQFIYGPSDRPQEPGSAGLPFGPGADIVQPTTDFDFRERTAQSLSRSANQSPEVKAFLAKMAEGL